MSQSIIVGVVSSDWANGSFVIHPFQTGREVMERAANRKRFTLDPRKHILATALEWKAVMDGDPYISSGVIAHELKLTPSRIRQILRLTRLHPDIQKRLLEMPLEESLKKFSGRKLKKLSEMPPKAQLEEFFSSLGKSEQL
jgi:hypothetical protein